MSPSKLREHRLRVLENQAKLAAQQAQRERPDPQMRIPLLVEVKSSPAAKQRAPRTRGKSRASQPDLGEL